MTERTARRDWVRGEEAVGNGERWGERVRNRFRRNRAAGSRQERGQRVSSREAFESRYLARN